MHNELNRKNRRLLRRCVLFLTLLMFLGVFTRLTPPQPAQAGPGVWTSDGPYGGNIQDIAFSPGFAADRTVFVATTQGVFKSTNGGDNWVKASQGLSPTHVTSLAITPNYTTSQTLFAGTAGGGVFKSVDGGTSWITINVGLDDLTVNTLAVAPTYPLTPTLLAGTMESLYYSGNGGDTWEYSGLLGRLYGVSDPMINDIAFSPGYADDLTVWLGTAVGPLHSNQGARTWVVPTQREGHSAIYDAPNKRMIVFGGYSYDSSYHYLNDVWALDLSAPGVETWTQLSPSGTPPTARYEHSAIYDAPNKRMIVFGGYSYDSSYHYLNDVWALDLSAPGVETWTQLSPSGTPSTARYKHSAIYDAPNKQMIVFGGYYCDSSCHYLNDVWALDLSTPGIEAWTQLSPSGTLPMVRYRSSAIYDVSNERMIVFGGYGSSGYLNDVWMLDLSTPGAETWIQLSPLGTLPTARYEHSAIYDPPNERMIVFGGYVGVYLNEVWTLDLRTPGIETWTLLNPSGTSPVVRSNHSAIYDAANERMIAFGGYHYYDDDYDDSYHLNDAWTLNLISPGTETWVQLGPPGILPTARRDHNAIYDAANERMIVFDGVDVNWEPFDDIWMLDLSTPGAETWSLLNPSGTLPAAREGPGAIYDATNKRMIVFGGCSDDECLNDTWALDLSTPGAETWTLLSPLGTPPTARFSPSTIYDAPNERMIVFGGDSDGYSNGVWALDLNTPGAETWTQLNPSGTPPAARSNHSAIYDALNERMIIFGGADVNWEPFDDIWVLDLSIPGAESWTRLNPSGTPPTARYDHGAIYDAPNERMIIFNGINSDDEFLNDIWALDLSMPAGETWTQLNLLGTPLPARYLYSEIYDTPNERTIVFGGGSANSDEILNDMWMLDLSTPGQASWTTPNNIRAVALSPAYSTDGIVWISSVTGILHSVDDGETWTPRNTGLPTDALVQALAISPHYPADHTVFAGTEAGVYRSTDDGMTWTVMNNGLETIEVQALAASPAYQEDQTLFTGTDSSLYRSPNGGLGWVAANVGLTAVNVQRIAISPSFSDDHTVFAAGETGVYKSTAAGTLWTGVNNGITTRQTYDIALSPGYSGDQTLFAATAEGVFRSGDGGAGWASFTNGLEVGSVDHLALSPQFTTDWSLFAVLGGGDGVQRSTDAGGHWEVPVLRGLTTNAIVLSPIFGADRRAWAGTTNGWLTTTGNDTWQGWPSARPFHSAIYDAPHERMIVFGGYGYNDVWALNLSTPGAETWTRLSPGGTLPSARYNHSAIYDVAHQRMIVFGGYGSGGYRNDLWVLDLSTPGAETWTQLSPGGTLPSARDSHSAIYDATHQRMIVFGGYGSGGYRNDLWALDLSMPGAGTWTQLSPGGTLPSARDSHSAIYDATHQRMIVFGGYGSGGYSNDLWVLDLNTPGAETWTQLSPGGTLPSARSGHSAIYDAPNERMIVFGGYYYDEGGRYLNDVWALNLSTPGTETWTQLSPGRILPSSRSGHSAIYDIAHQQMIVFGGDDDSNVWALSLSTPETETWTQFPNGAWPSSRPGHSAIYDIAHQRMVVFGGYYYDSSYHYLNDAWTLDPSMPGTETWTQLSPGGTWPSARYSHSAIYDAPNERMIVFGGYYYDEGGRYLNDVWALNLSTPGTETWTQLSPGRILPSSRSGHSAIYDIAHQQMIVFGGAYYDGNSRYLNDTWTLNLSTPGAETWTRLSPGGTWPSARYSHSAIYDATHQRMIVFGGISAYNKCLNEVWALNMSTPGAGTWTQLSPSGTPPAVRSSHSAIYDALNKRMIIFGGYDNRYNFNDVWALDLSTPGAETWTQLSPGGARPPARHDHSAIYDVEYQQMIIFGGNGSRTLNNVWVLDLSTPGSEMWTSFLANYFTGQGVSLLAVSPSFGTDNTLLLVSQNTLYRSTNGGQTWVGFAVLPDISDLRFSPVYASDHTLYAVAAGDVYHSTDDGVTWTALSEGLNANTVSIAPEGQSWTLFAAAQNGVWRYTFPQPEAVRTLILTHQTRLRERYGQAAADALLQRLYTLAEHPQVQGLVVDLSDAEAYPEVAAAYIAWDASSPPGTLYLGDTVRANAVANAIRNVVLAHTAAYSNTHYLVLVGDDEIIPFHRLPDGTTPYARPYAEYAPITGTVALALAEGMTLSDDPYGALHPIAHPASGLPPLYVPDLAVGRLVESSDEILATLDAFLAGDQVNEHALAFVSGADYYLMDSAYAISDTLGAAHLATSHLIGNDWGAAELAPYLLGRDNDVVSLNQHAYHDRLMAPDDSYLTPQEVLSATGDLERTLVYATGCHAGLSLPDAPNPTGGLDFPQAFARRGAPFVGNTGYGWATLYSIGLTERLLLYYTQQLAPGPGNSTTIGQALRDAKRQYYLNAWRFDEYDAKVLNELTLYGLPMYRIATPVSRQPSAVSRQASNPPISPPAHQPTGVAITYTTPTAQALSPITEYGMRNTQYTGNDNAYTLHTSQSVNASLPPFVTQASIQFQFPTENFEVSEVGEARYYSYLGEVQANRGMPLLPRFSFGVSIPGAQTQGVIFTGGVYSDVIAAAITTTAIISDSGALDTSSDYVPGRWYPSILALITQLAEGGHDRLTTSLARMSRGTGPDGETMTVTQRLYDDVAFEVYYYNQLGGVPDRTPPQVTMVQTEVVGLYGWLSVAVTDPLGAGDTDALGVWRVVVAYTPNAAGTGRWESVELEYDSAAARWIGTIPLTVGNAYPTLLIVQAVDRGGNVTADDNDGAYYTLPSPTHEPLQAAFVAAPLAGQPPLTVVFTDTSTGPVTAWLWEFGDGVTSTVQRPTHTYTLSNTFTVSLTVSGAGDSATYVRAEYIRVYAAPLIANFTAYPTSGLLPLTVQFTDASAGAVSAWLWDFGDGITSTMQSPTHTYTLSSTFTVSLTVNGPAGYDTFARTEYIHVYEAPLIANFTAHPTSGALPLTVQFTDTSTGPVIAWLWNFGDGMASARQNPIHTYTAVGAYTVTQTVAGTRGAAKLTRANYITVYYPDLAASFEAAPLTGGAPLTVIFTDTSAGIVDIWIWTFGDGHGSTASNPVHTYTTAGVYTLTLTVIGPSGGHGIVRPSLIAVLPPKQYHVYLPLVLKQ